MFLILDVVIKIIREYKDNYSYKSRISIDYGREIVKFLKELNSLYIMRQTQGILIIFSGFILKVNFTQCRQGNSRIIGLSHP
jgi:hypothetical protein